MTYDVQSQSRIKELEDQIKLLTTQRNTLAFNAGETHGKLERELRQTREDAALVVHALNCAIQLVGTLIAFIPDGSPMHPGVGAAKGALDQAMHAIKGAIRE